MGLDEFVGRANSSRDLVLGLRHRSSAKSRMLALSTKSWELHKSVPRIGCQIEATPLPRRVASVETRRVQGDRSKFVRDVTVPDGSIVHVGERFEKVWEIQNAGNVFWRGRKLRRSWREHGIGRLRSEATTDIPDTKPGETVLIHIWVTAPPHAGSCFAVWKMIDDTGRECFPKLTGLFVSVDVVTE